MHKGGRDGDLTPTLSLLPTSNRVSLRVSTGVSSPRETWATSKGELPVGEWTHLAFASCPAAGAGGQAVMRFYLGGALDTSLELTAPAVTNPGTWFFGAHGRVEAPEALLANVEVYPNLLGEDGVRRAGQRALAELPAVRPKPPMPVLWHIILSSIHFVCYYFFFNLNNKFKERTTILNSTLNRNILKIFI